MKKGFTLLELLIVIIIIGLLATIGLVQYNRAVQNARNAAGKSMLGEMRKVAQAYQAATGSWPTGGEDDIVVTLPDGDESLEFHSADGASTNFEYVVDGDGAGGTATHTNACTGCRDWHINFATGEITVVAAGT